MLTSTRRHRVALGLVAAGSALALAACGADDPEPARTDTTAEDPWEEEEETAEVDASAFNQGPVPDETPELDSDADLPPEPASDAPLGDRIAWEALDRVSTFASMADPDATYTCPEIEGEEGESVTCTVTFLSEDFDYTIDVQSSGILINYEWDLPEGPLVREVIEDSLRVSAQTEYVLCDMDSDLERGETGGKAPFLCQSLDEETGDVTDWEISISQYGSFSFYRA
jgi:hypothetical protein